MKNPASQTIYGPMCIAAIEQYYPEKQRLVKDELAIQFLPATLRAFVCLTRWSILRKLFYTLSEIRGHGVWGAVLCRKHYINDKLENALKAGVNAVVILGAGLDTCAYRSNALADLPVFEVDLPKNSAYKKTRLQHIYHQVPAHIRLIGLNIDEQDLESTLISHGYQIKREVFFIWEAVTQYLTADGVRDTFRFLSRAISGSHLVFTYIRQDFIDGTALYSLEALHKNYCGKTPVWKFGMIPEQIEPFLQEYGWQVREHLGAQEYLKNFVKPIGRDLTVTEIERTVHAVKM
jgi:methyltransferase (TIGR00027 family)